MASSKLFTQIYRTLPPESQEAFVEEQLAPLLDALSSKKRDRIIRAAKRSQAHFDGVPVLDLKGKKREMQTLLMMLSKDDKVAFTRERSNREEILQEAVHSITSWLNKIWLTVYEYKVNFELAHECLLYAIKSLTILEDSPGAGECRCLYNNMYVTLALKDRQRRTVKYFSFTGPRNLEQTCLWIWRDLFLSMLAEDRRSMTRVKEMLVDIEQILGWGGLEQMLYGGRTRSGEDEEDSYHDDDEDDDEADEEEGLLRGYEDVGTDDEYDLDSEGDSHWCCRFHAKYWSDEMNEERITLREIVKARLVDIFRETPEADLFGAIGSISQDPTSRTIKKLLEILTEIAGESADAFKDALAIHTDLYHPRRILTLLESHYHYLRPSDCPVLLSAVSVLADSSCRPHALKFIERELLDALRHIYVAVRSAFSHFSEEINKTDLTDLLKLQSDSSLRASRVERWVDRALTPAGSEPMGPMALAAIMMGFPVGPPPGSLDETDLLAYIDLNKPDPDLDDLREEFKPQLKPRFETWNLYAQSMSKDCAGILHRVYAKIVELMPFFRGTDVVQEMTSRLNDRPSKGYITDAMVCISSFCKSHRKRYLEPRRRSKKTAPKTTTSNIPAPQASTNAAAGSGTNSSTSSAAPNNPNPGPNPPLTATQATGPILHIFGPNNSVNSMPVASFFSGGLPHIHNANNNNNNNQNNNQNHNQNTGPPVHGPPPPPPPQHHTHAHGPQHQHQGPQSPTFGGQPPIITSALPPPPDSCNHQ